jgi:6,7-dimethyl-8-ribityllumazine synthase
MAKFLIVEARFYDHLNDMLVEGAKAALEDEGHKADVITVPGALEIPGAIALAAESGRYDGFVAIGVVIRGETYHFEIVAGESARGIMALTMDGIAIGNGILTVENEQQALVRADPAQKDKGGEAAKAAIALLELKSQFGRVDLIFAQRRRERRRSWNEWLCSGLEPEPRGASFLLKGERTPRKPHPLGNRP